MSRLLSFRTDQRADLPDADPALCAKPDLQCLIDDLTVLALMRPMAIVLLAQLARAFVRPLR